MSTETSSTSTDLTFPGLQSKQELIATDSFTPETWKRVEQEVDNIPFVVGGRLALNTTIPLTFGAKPQEALGQFLETLIGDMKAKDAGIAGDLAIELARGIEMMNLHQVKEELTQPQSMLGKLWKSLTFASSAIEGFWAQHQEVLKLIDAIKQKTETRKRALLFDLEKLDKLLAQYQVHADEVRLYIAVGDRVLEKAESEFQSLSTKTQNDPERVAALKDFRDWITSFDVRLLNLKVAFTQSVTTAPTKVRLIQESQKVEIQNIIESILFDLPKLMDAIIQMGSLSNIKEAQAEDDARRKVTEQLDSLSAEAIQQAYLQSKSSQGRALETVERLNTVAEHLVQTLEQGKALEAQNEEKRQQAEAGLMEIQHKVAQALEDASRPA